MRARVMCGWRPAERLDLCRLDGKRHYAHHDFRRLFTHTAVLELQHRRPEHQREMRGLGVLKTKNVLPGPQSFLQSLKLPLGLVDKRQGEEGGAEREGEHHQPIRYAHGKVYDTCHEYSVWFEAPLHCVQGRTSP